MASGSVTLSVPQMIDLAVNFPECGAVNYNVMHSLLHVIAQQLELVQCKVEFKGKDGERIQNLMTTVPTEASLKLTEYVISPSEDAGKVVERKTEAEGVQTVILVEQTTPEGQAYEPCMISQKRLSDMDLQISSLKEKVQELAELPGNKQLMDALKSEGIGKGSPVLDMFHIMSLSKRVEANETGMDKLGSMIEDLAKNTPTFDIGAADIGGDLGGMISNLQDRLTNVETIIETGSPGSIPGGPGSMGGSIRRSIKSQPGDTASQGGGSVKGSAGGGRVSIGGGSVAGGGSVGPPGSPSGGGRPSVGGASGKSNKSASIKSGNYAVDLDVPDFNAVHPDDLGATIRKEIKKMKMEVKLIYDKIGMLFDLQEEFSPEEIIEGFRLAVKRYRTASTAKDGPPADPSDLPTSERIEQLEDRFNGTSEQIASLDSNFNQEINNLHSQFAEMEKSFGGIMEKIHFGLPAGDSPASGETVGELYEKLVALQSDMENLAETASKLIMDKEEKHRIIEVLTEQVEFLKTVKADKEDLEDALADKADACAINRKVSHDQFDTACDELSKGIEEALGKLTQQEELWQQALDEIQKEIGNKLDRMELGPLRDFINNKLKMLQQRLKALTALKQETEAAGSKKFLRNVNCISCDKDVVMRKEMDPSLLPQPYAMPPSRSMGPYLAYELDALRKQQKALPNSRNLNYFESAMHQKSPRGDDHICNRYCGGSHTITTPQQRVTRLGHFLNQWGPEAQAVSDADKKKEEELAVVGHASVQEATPRLSKAQSAEKDVARKSSQMEKRSSTTKPKVTPRSSAVGTPKGSGEAIAEKRESTTQKQSQASLKRGSQLSARSGDKPPDDKSGSRISAKIPEETASQVAEDAGEPPLEGDEGIQGSARGSQEIPKQSSSQAVAAKGSKDSSNKPPSRTPSKQGSQATPRGSLQRADGAAAPTSKGSLKPAEGSVTAAPKASIHKAEGSVTATPRTSVQKANEAPAEAPAEAAPAESEAPAEAPESPPPE